MPKIKKIRGHLVVPLHETEKIRLPFNDFWRHIVSCSHSLNNKLYRQSKSQIISLTK